MRAGWGDWKDVVYCRTCWRQFQGACKEETMNMLAEEDGNANGSEAGIAGNVDGNSAESAVLAIGDSNAGSEIA